MRIKLLLSLVFSILIFSKLLSEKPADYILAKIGKEIILYSDLLKHINQIKSARMMTDELTTESILENMIDNKLIVQKAREQNVRVNEREIKSSAENYLNQVRSQFPSAREFNRELRNSGLTVTDLRKYYEDMLTEQHLRRELIRQEISNKINITDSDLFDYFQEHQDNIPMKDNTYELAVIVRIPQPSSQTVRLAKAKIDEIKNKIQKGSDFTQLAKQFSDCPSKSVGGDLGYFTKGMMVKEFEDVAFNTGVNEISDVVRTQFGFHILMVTDKNENEVRASHILAQINESENDVQSEIDLLNDIIQKVSKGESFSKLAEEYSQDTETKTNGGIIGELTKDEFPPWFSDDLKQLQIGELSKVLENEKVFYLYTINRSFEPRSLSFDEMKQDLSELLKSEIQEELYNKWMENLKKEFFVQKYTERISNININEI